MLGAVKTSPVCAVQVEAGEMDIQCEQLLLNYWIDLKRHRDGHPTKIVLQASLEKERAPKFSFG